MILKILFNPKGHKLLRDYALNIILNFEEGERRKRRGREKKMIEVLDYFSVCRMNYMRYLFIEKIHNMCETLKTSNSHITLRIIN